LLGGGAAHAETWNIDAAHTRVGFRVAHMVVSSVEGRFHDVEGTIEIDDKFPVNSAVTLTIAAASIDTENEKRDGHLKSADFFDVAKYPQITFRSTKVVVAGRNRYRLTGDLTIRDVRRSVTLDVTASDALADPSGKPMRGVSVEGKLNRRDFGLTWNQALDRGGVLVGEVVTLNVQFELTRSP
jgi:polyisoprenoid-binding protein YceI